MNALQVAMRLAREYGGNAQAICSRTVFVMVPSGTLVPMTFSAAYNHACSAGEAEEFIEAAIAQLYPDICQCGCRGRIHAQGVSTTSEG